MDYGRLILYSIFGLYCLSKFIKSKDQLNLIFCLVSLFGLTSLNFLFVDGKINTFFDGNFTNNNLYLTINTVVLFAIMYTSINYFYKKKLSK